MEKIKKSDEQLKDKEFNSFLNILSWSFYHSQGSLVFQGKIFKYLLQENSELADINFPDPREVDIFAEEASKKMSSILNAYTSLTERHDTVMVQSSKNLTEEEVDTKSTLWNVAKSFNDISSGKILTNDVNISEIIDEIISSDGMYVSRRTNMYREKSKEDKSKLSKLAHSSHFISFVLDNKPVPGGVFFRDLYDDIRTYVNSDDLTTVERLKINQFIRYYNNLNPEDKHKEI